MFPAGAFLEFRLERFGVVRCQQRGSPHAYEHAGSLERNRLEDAFPFDVDQVDISHGERQEGFDH